MKLFKLRPDWRSMTSINKWLVQKDLFLHASERGDWFAVVIITFFRQKAVVIITSDEERKTTSSSSRVSSGIFRIYDLNSKFQRLHVYSCASLSWYCPTNQGRKIKKRLIHIYRLLVWGVPVESRSSLQLTRVDISETLSRVAFVDHSSSSIEGHLILFLL